jgi:hypothetical protein
MAPAAPGAPGETKMEEKKMEEKKDEGAKTK